MYFRHFLRKKQQYFICFPQQFYYFAAIILKYIVRQMQAEHNVQNDNNQNVNEQERQKLVDEDPFGPSYHDSAIKYLPYRIGIIVIAVFLIIIGKSSLPSDEVPCIEDAILNNITSVTAFYINHQGFGLTVVSIMQLIVDIQLVLMLVYWFIYGNSLRYPLVLAIIGISKILLNVLFQTKAIQGSFTQQAFPSLVFGSNFKSTYFFSGVMCLMMAVLLELYEEKHKKLFVGQIVALVYVIFILLSTRQNFFMDIATALVFTHYIFYFINDRIKTIDQFAFKVYDKITGKSSEGAEEHLQNY